MKIALITPSYSRDATDWCIPVLRDYAEMLAQRGVDVHVFALAYPPECREYCLGGVTVHAVGGGRLLAWLRDGRVFVRAVSMIAAEDRCARFDALHAVFADECGPVAVAAARRLRRRLVVTCAGGELAALRHIGYGSELSWPRTLAVRLALAGADRVVLPGAYMQGLFRRRYRRAVDVIPWGVDTRRFAPAPPAGDRTPTVLCVAELRPVKNAALLVRAFTRAAQIRPGARLVFIGGGQAPALPAGLPVELRARAQWDELPRAYAGAEVFALSSWHEAFGMAALEAMACGLPLAGTSVGVIAEACAGACPAGLCVAPGDEDALAGALARLLDDAALRADLGRNARAQAEAQYDWNVLAVRFVALYEN